MERWTGLKISSVAIQCDWMYVLSSLLHCIDTRPVRKADADKSEVRHHWESYDKWESVTVVQAWIIRQYCHTASLEIDRTCIYTVNWTTYQNAVCHIFYKTWPQCRMDGNRTANIVWCWSVQQVTQWLDADNETRQGDYTVSHKKFPPLNSVALSNLSRFSKFLHCWKMHEICYKAHTTLPTSP